MRLSKHNVDACFCIAVAAFVSIGDAAAASSVFAEVEKILSDATAHHEVPAAVALAGDASGQRWAGAFGNFTNDGRPPFGVATLATRFDMASLTKVVATTSAVALLQQRGLLNLQDPVASPQLLGPFGFAAQGKAEVTVADCLVHAAGFPPDPQPCYWDPTFGCKGAPLTDAPPSFACSEHIFAGVINQTLVRPPNTVYQYSDLSMITLMYVVGTVVRSHGLVGESSLLPACANTPLGGEGLSLQCHYEAFVRTQVFDVLGMKTAGFRPARTVGPQCAPTAVPHAEGLGFRTLQGEVNDGNSFFLGGIAGHAGLFAEASDLEKLVRALLLAPPSDAPFLNKTTVALFTSTWNATQSRRALGWDTNSSLCGSGGFSELTFTHTGYTGTEICADPTTKRYSILLTNRVYPIDDDASEERISALRKRYQTAVAAALSALSPASLV